MNKQVYVQDQNGQPLMPTNPAKARHMLDDGRAEIVQSDPFTIQLTYEIEGEKNTEDVTLGIDAGYSKVGFSAVTEDEELIAGELELRNDISRKLEQRRNYRRTRRSRNTRYREPRFDNREREEGWLAPSIRHKKNEHIRLVNKIKEILPIDKVIVEVAQFDTQKMESPEINGKKYQQGTLQGYNVRNYLLQKFDHKCVYCGATDVPLEIEHIVPKSRDGSDRVSNLTISCHDCNQEKDNQTAKEFGYPRVQEQAKRSLKSAAFMNIVRWKIVNELDANHTFGHITKKRRIENDIEKSHVNDAFVIAGGNGQKRSKSIQVSRQRRNNRSIQLNRKEYGRSIRKQRYDIQLGDLLEHKQTSKQSQSKGIMNYGRYVVVDDSQDNYWKTENVEVINYGQGLSFN